MARIINSVVTKAGVIIRVSEGKAYSHAIVKADGVGVDGWAGRPDLAAKAAAKIGGTAVPVVLLDKLPKDPNPELKTCEIEYQYESERGGMYTARGTAVVDTDGKVYFNNWQTGWQEAGDDAKLGKPVTGYLDRIYFLYRFKEWKASR